MGGIRSGRCPGITSLDIREFRRRVGRSASGTRENGSFTVPANERGDAHPESWHEYRPSELLSQPFDRAEHEDQGRIRFHGASKDNGRRGTDG